MENKLRNKPIESENLHQINFTLTPIIIQPTLSSSERSALIGDIIYTWAGVENVDPKSRAARMIYGNAIGDARKLEALEEFMGQVANDEDWRVVA